MKRITLMGFLNFLLFLCAVAILVIALTSCSSKKKTVQKTETRIEQKTETTEKEIQKTEVEKEVSELKIIKVSEKDHEDYFSGEVADPSLPARKIEEEKDGVKTTTYENFRNVDHGKSNSETEKNKKVEIEITEKEVSEKEAEKTSRIEEKKKEKHLDSDLEKKSKEKAFYWIIPLAILILFSLFINRYFRPFR